MTKNLCCFRRDGACPVSWWSRLGDAACRVSTVLTAALLLAAGSAPAQIGIGGVADQTVYAAPVSFTITNEAGFVYAAQLDGAPVAVGATVLVSAVDYHELVAWRTNTATLAATSRLVRFIIRSAERGTTEQGLPAWTPYPMIPSTAAECAGATLRLITPAAFPAGYPIPVVAWIEQGLGETVRVNGDLAAAGHPSIPIKRGVGSGFLAATNAAGDLVYDAQLAGLTASRTIAVEAAPTWTTVGGVLPAGTVWPAGSRIAVTNHLTIPAGGALTIGAGTVVRLNAGLEITNDGSLFIGGSPADPVVFMPTNAANPWGGLLLQRAGSLVAATGALFTGSGAVAAWFGATGHPGSHRTEQALFYCSNTPALYLTDCAAIRLAGQFGHAVNGGSITLRRVLCQRMTSAGQYGGAAFDVADSAFIEFPDDTVNFVDGDNDALYIEDGFHVFTNTLFGWAKDDGIDSGADGAGVLTFGRCWFESTFHEGNSLSGTGKNSIHRDGVFINCGQALEAGYSAPSGFMVRCLSTANAIGSRFGDNYTSGYSYNGFMRATNCLLLYNHRDVWGVRYQPSWTYQTNQLDVQANWLTASNAAHPNNLIWSPAADGWRVAAFMTTPPGAAVGVGLAIRSNQFTLAALSNGLPVRLSSFTTNTVTVPYAADGASGTLTNGALVFTPGETVKAIPLTGALTNAGMVRVRLQTPAGGEITGVREAWYIQPATTSAAVTLVATGAVWRYLDNGSDQGTNWVAPAFDDLGWSSGGAELGFSASNHQTTILSYGGVPSNKHVTYYFRRAFTVAQAGDFATLTVRLKRDDGAVVYLNGTEIMRSNLTNQPLTHLSLAINASDNGTTFQVTNVTAGALVSGTNVLAVEVHQSSVSSSDLNFDLALEAAPMPTLDVQKFAGDHVLLWTDPTLRLEHAADLSGPWLLDNSSSPATLEPGGPQSFYRLRRP